MQTILPKSRLLATIDGGFLCSGTSENFHGNLGFGISTKVKIGVFTRTGTYLRLHKPTLYRPVLPDCENSPHSPETLLAAGTNFQQTGIQTGLLELKFRHLASASSILLNASSTRAWQVRWT
jgi:hypothetical protein